MVTGREGGAAKQLCACAEVCHEYSSDCSFMCASTMGMSWGKLGYPHVDVTGKTAIVTGHVWYWV